ncbi:hypothetical protein VIBNISO65_440056 [Vibrio nigripulchritudo SO65]|uniref:hypothetical protein n=1 Tax=Vibrio nigripulchritudo TaxID=28173 RepID=UPI0003B1928A|nr:hypothetical protein [Vibrio nigripulchritudo]CCN35725.1 hypothetical protein VIBNIAM115_1920055 [Vibrio nigripulchritudo AM115]CCN43697.1 hypothetical protein VIBNIFTn2_60056 [Vibrio nigripulchritudo FTn2]CCN65982.1 hypothetical protein VIBNIPon4_480019 [Vibrio nigripulchritudo POn4]CCN77999.1 hypothetical protein VIBNISO65_440056 [Vibrio nigripulchritudo SO65]
MVIRWLIFVFTVLIALLYLSGVFYFWEPDDIKKGSPAYYLKLPKEVREFDYYQSIDDVTFSYRVADGVKPTIISAKFMQNTPFYSFRHQLVKAGFQCQGIAESLSIRCAGKYVDGRVSFIIRRLKNEASEVEATFVGVGDS